MNIITAHTSIFSECCVINCDAENSSQSLVTMAKWEGRWLCSNQKITISLMNNSAWSAVITFDSNSVWGKHLPKCLSNCHCFIKNALWENGKQKITNPSQKMSSLLLKSTNTEGKVSIFMIDTCLLIVVFRHLFIRCSQQRWDVCQTKDLSSLQVCYQISDYITY